MPKQIKTNKIQPDDMADLWNYDKKTGRITQFVIVPSRDHTNEIEKKYAGWWGKGGKDWGSDGFRNEPAGLFAYLATARGFASETVDRKVLTEFSKVDNQDWASFTVDWLNDPL